jgi:hypothetical protein
MNRATREHIWTQLELDLIIKQVICEHETSLDY